MDAYHLPAYAVEGHNQVIDTLGKQGVLGIAMLVVWLAAAVLTIYRLKGQRRVLPAALLGFMVGRSVFEVPLDVYFIGPGTISIAAFAAAAAWVPSRVPVPARVPNRSGVQRRGPAVGYRHSSAAIPPGP